MKKKQRLILEYIIIAISPVIILSQADINDYSLPYIPLFIWVLLSILIMWKEGFSIEQIGLGKKNLTNGVGWYLLITLFCVFFIYIAAKLLNKPIEQDLTQYWHFKFFFIPVSVFQELIYRGFMLTTLKMFVPYKALAILINTLAFVALHMFFPDFQITFFMPLWFGLVMDVIYWDKPNLVMASITHSIVNFAVLTVNWL